MRIDRASIRRMRILRTAIACLLLALPSLSHAQSRFGLELDLGADVPLGPTMRSVVSLETQPDSGDEAVGTPRLSNRRNRVGVHAGLSAHVGTLEVEYRFERFAWNGARVRCLGDRDARQLPNGEFEDAEVRYNCSVPNDTVVYDGEDLRPLVFHHLIVAPRFYLRSRAVQAGTADGDDAPVKRDPMRLYLSAGGGLSVAQYDDPNLGGTTRVGFNVGGATGVEFPVERRLSIGLELRYMLSLVSVPSSPSASSGRAVATQRNVLGALMDPIHRLGLNLTFRFDFR